MGEMYRVRGSEALKAEPNYALPLEKGLPISQPIRPKRKSEREEEKLVDPAYAPVRIGVETGFFVISAVTLMVMAYFYLKSFQEVRMIDKDIRKISAQTAELKAENDEREKELYAGINFEKIREKAIKELKMVYPYEGKIIRYKAVNGGYFRQYQSFDENSGKKSLVEMVAKAFLK